MLVFLVRLHLAFILCIIYLNMLVLIIMHIIGCYLYLFSLLNANKSKRYWLGPVWFENVARACLVWERAFCYHFMFSCLLHFAKMPPWFHNSIDLLISRSVWDGNNQGGIFVGKRPWNENQFVFQSKQALKCYMTVWLQKAFGFLLILCLVYL